jgi:hypothetical protein
VPDVELMVVLVAAEVEEAVVVEDVSIDVLDDGDTELLVPVVELAELAELEDEPVVVVPPGDGAEEK